MALARQTDSEKEIEKLDGKPPPRYSNTVEYIPTSFLLSFILAFAAKLFWSFWRRQFEKMLCPFGGLYKRSTYLDLTKVCQIYSPSQFWDRQS